MQGSNVGKFKRGRTKMEEELVKVNLIIDEMEKEMMAMPMSRDPYVVEQLIKKAELFSKQNKIYGDNFIRFGPVLSLILANQKLDAMNSADMARLGILVHIVTKITRYAENFNRGGHSDSLDDIAVYAMMLKQLDSTT